MIPWCWHQPVLPPLLTGGSFHLSAHTTLALISQFPRQVWGFAWNCCIPKCVSSFLMWFRVVCCLCQQEKKGLTTLTYLLKTQSALRKLQRGALQIRPDQSRVRRAPMQMWTWAFHDSRLERPEFIELFQKWYHPGSIHPTAYIWNFRNLDSGHTKLSGWFRCKTLRCEKLVMLSSGRSWISKLNDIHCKIVMLHLNYTLCKTLLMPWSLKQWQND